MCHAFMLDFASRWSGINSSTKIKNTKVRQGLNSMFDINSSKYRLTM